MAAATAPPGGKKKDNVLTRKIGPLPTWAWTAIIAAVLLLFVFWRSTKNSSQQQQPGTGKARGFGGSVTPPVAVQGSAAQDDDDDQDRGKHHRRTAGGPERQWLIKKTGSQHPWSFLARHHETIEVGPRGSRIVHGADPRRRRHRRDHAEATEAAATPTRPVPGQPAGGVMGQLVSFTTPQAGPAPSLAQVAAQFNTAPDAIVEEATGRGSPHGAMWRRYVAAHDWEAPLPHGTDITVLAQPQ
jgi:hypothetical protein